MPRRFASRTELRVMIKLLETHLKEVEGGFEYDEGWSDQAVAEACSEDKQRLVSKSSVQHTRAELFGHLATRAMPTPDKVKRLAEAKVLIERLDGRLAALEQLVALVIDRHNTLCETLNLNRVVQVKHLKIEPKANGAARPNAAA